MKVAIVGLSPTHKDAPWADPAWQKWGLGWDANALRLDRTFEMHDARQLRAYPNAESYFDRLRQCLGVHVQEPMAEVPAAVAYPLADVAGTCGAYWCSSLAYALALAIHEGAEQIGLWGIDMKGAEEYGYQRPNMEYLCGLARGKGIDVYIPAQSPLLKFESDPDFDYRGRYGWLG